jgi:hypothetical protein
MAGLISARRRNKPLLLDIDIIQRGAEFYVRRTFPEHQQDHLIAALVRRVERDVRLAKILMEAGISPPQAATTLQSSDRTEPSPAGHQRHQA